MSPTTKLIAALLAASSLTACTTVGPDFKAPDAPETTSTLGAGETAPAAARLEAEAANAGPWWTALNSPELDAVIRQALKDSPTLAEADATLAQSQSALAQARGVAGPQVTGNAGVARERANLQAFGFTGFGDIKLSNPTFSLYSVGGAVSYDLDLWGGNRRRIESATGRAEAEGRRAEAAYLSLTANVALQAATIATLRAQIASVERMIADDQANIELIHKANALGGSTSLAKVSAASQLEEDRAQLPALQGELAAARHALAVLVGKAPADWSAPAFDLSTMALSAPVPVTLPSQLVRKRPDILAAEAELHAATADIGVTTADLYPNLKLTASLTQGALKPGDIFSYDASGWDLGAGLTAPIFDGGALKARRQQAREAARAASARYQQTVLTAFGQVADTLSALSSDEAALAAHARTEQQATERLRLARVAFDKGGGTLLEVVDAQRTLNATRSAQARAKGQRLVDAIRLFAATGADWRTG
ncbi:efflux transporter outer membrane subunit [Caulobacter sp. FWC2]|uniref:efflux transporter outer membrane subunit n=1 Tax=Caulobacter sp. FWC2 TaxID=69664 RepID=UPI000C14A90D|nr:efflux transporter outer membrane subunit [Caulobacter sp. FWC2]PIB91879.1 RND transporter [Caulobacter sp. FWC2]